MSAEDDRNRFAVTKRIWFVSRDIHFYLPHNYCKPLKMPCQICNRTVTLVKPSSFQPFPLLLPYGAEISFPKFTAASSFCINCSRRICIFFCTLLSCVVATLISKENLFPPIGKCKFSYTHFDVTRHGGKNELPVRCAPPTCSYASQRLRVARSCFFPSGGGVLFGNNRLYLSSKAFRGILRHMSRAALWRLAKGGSHEAFCV